MKKILGLDLGSSSIGWAIVEEHSKEIITREDIISNSDNIVAIGCRIIPYSNEDKSAAQFSSGQAITKNSQRTQLRTQRKGYNRYKIRRELLLEELMRLGMYSGTTLKLKTLELWGIRAKATNEQVSLLELGRILCHINQKRGYRTAKTDYSDKNLGAYVSSVVGRHKELKEKELTVGQFLYTSLVNNSSFRCKDLVFPRDAYVEEYDAIMKCQQRYYPEILTCEVVAYIRDYIIFHQRALKSCKHLVARCELERCDVKVGETIRNQGPKVVHRSSPLFQVCKIWESINNLRVKNRYNDELHITLEQKYEIFKYMNTHEKLKATDLKRILNIKTKEWLFSDVVGAGLQGNTTYCAIEKALSDCNQKNKWLKFELSTIEKVNEETGEIIKVIDPSCEEQPLYKIWHTLYSIPNIKELRNVLINRYEITDESVLDALCRIDFVKSGYGNKSARAIRKILPYLQDGLQYTFAKEAAGYDIRNIGKNEVLATSLMHIPKGALRQPVVEKVLNQLVNLVNALMKEYGCFDEIRIELARELKQSREERLLATKAINDAQRLNEAIAKRINEEYGLTPTKLRIDKYKMWQDAEFVCIYCGKQINVKDFLVGDNINVEHVIPRSLLFDNSFSNKVCACRKCNEDKNNRTAYDFMKEKGDSEFDAYVNRVNDLYERKKISKAKYTKLLMSAKDIPSDFIERQLRESQYIATKAKEMLQTVCSNVYSTSGSITEYVRHLWGWDDVLHDLNFARYKTVGLTESVEREVNGTKKSVERIVGWSKRIDHRHHAVDALAIACTKQSYIQRISTINSMKEEAFKNVADSCQDAKTQKRISNLDRYIQMQPHFSTAEVQKAIAGIIVSYKGGKRVSTPGKRYIYRGGKRICVQKNIIVPRGPLCESSIYGRIYDNQKGREEYVLKYDISTITLKNVDSVVDKAIREILRTRLLVFKEEPKKAFAEPIFDTQGREIRSVRCFTGLKAVEPLRYNDKGSPIAYAKLGNNHHIAIYEDENGKLHEHIATFWHAVERKKYGIPTIITNPASVWDNISHNVPDAFLEKLPESASWKFKFSILQNEMFVLGMNEEEYNDAMRAADYATLSKHLYRVQSISKSDYFFRHHCETTVDDKYNGKKNLMLSVQLGKLIRINSIGALLKLNMHKVHVSVTGKITEV